MPSQLRESGPPPDISPARSILGTFGFLGFLAALSTLHPSRKPVEIPPAVQSVVDAKSSQVDSFFSVIAHGFSSSYNPAPSAQERTDAVDALASAVIGQKLGTSVDCHSGECTTGPQTVFPSLRACS